MKKRNQFKGVVVAALIGGVFALSCTGNSKKWKLWKRMMKKERLGMT